MRERIITGVYFNQNRDEPEVIKFDSNSGLVSVQRLVDGYIELVTPEMFDNSDERIKNLDIWINEDGRLIEGMIPNIQLNPEFEDESVLYGDLVVLAKDEKGNFSSIPEERIKSVIECLKEMRKNLEKKNNQ